MPTRGRLEAVLDTNIYVSGTISPSGPAFQALRAWQLGQFVVVTADAQIAEISGVLHRPRFAGALGVVPDAIDALEHRLRSEAKLVDPLHPVPLHVRDPDDAVILSIAMTGKADFLVTGDRDLLVLADDPRLVDLRIATLAEFLGLMGQQL